MPKVVLVVLFNHNYDRNLPELTQIYSSRFSSVRFLMPFYMGSREDVIPVYENSFYFEGYVAQSWRHLQHLSCDHFLFVADDLLLNPSITESNYLQAFALTGGSSFISDVTELHNFPDFWWRCKEAIAWRPEIRGAELQGTLPPKREAIQCYARHGLAPVLPLPARICTPPSSTQAETQDSAKTFPLAYPLVGGYSDIFVVARESMQSFVNYCGSFAVTRLHAELAIPSALALASERLSTSGNTTLKGRALWSKDDEEVLVPFNRSLKQLLTNFPKDYMFIHPVKLSQWHE